MQVQVHYQGLDNSPWVNQFINERIQKLNRYLGSASAVQINLKLENKRYLVGLAIHNKNQDYAFNGEGDNLYGAFSLALDKANRALGEHKRMLKDKINRRYAPLKNAVA